jgi:hypothetical protein
MAYVVMVQCPNTDKAVIGFPLLLGFRHSFVHRQCTGIRGDKNTIMEIIKPGSTAAGAR